jgi:hypothetical protein
MDCEGLTPITHKVINVSTTMDTQGLVIYATILYEDEPQIK